MSPPSRAEVPTRLCRGRRMKVGALRGTRYQVRMITQPAPADGCPRRAILRGNEHGFGRPFRTMIAGLLTMRRIRYRTQENCRLAAISQLLGSALRSRYDLYSACGAGRHPGRAAGTGDKRFQCVRSQIPLFPLLARDCRRYNDAWTMGRRVATVVMPQRTSIH
jgi:hypothetical protein